MHESYLVRVILARLRALEGCHAVKNHGSRYGRAGEPDIYGSYLGHAFAIEVKVKGGRVTPLQMFRLDQWAKAGARCGIAYSVEDALEIVRGE